MLLPTLTKGLSTIETTTETTDGITAKTNTETAQKTVLVCDMGRLDYQQAWHKQLELHRRVAEGTVPPTLLLVEHPPVITFGRKGGRENLLTDEATLRQDGFSLYDIERGGDVTYHGPGQLVGYPIFRVGRRVRDFLRNLEQVIVQVLDGYDIPSAGSSGYAGVWVDDVNPLVGANKDAKITAIGVAVKRHVAFHGFAMNVSTNLEHFAHIVPCGITDKRVTSLSQLLGREVALEEVKPKIISAFSDVFDITMTPVSDHELFGECSELLDETQAVL
jgi:lipoyl(octanoyl) transferase